MMKKIVLALGLFVLTLQNLVAAPYNLDAPIESYTWGENFMTVWANRGEEEKAHKISDETILLVQEDDSALLLSFWHNQLFGISRSFPTHKMTPEEKSAIRSRQMEELTARFGKPALKRPCLPSPLICSEVVWYPTVATQVTLYENTDQADKPFVGYAYSSREIQPKYDQEVKEFGPRFEPGYVVKVFTEKPAYAEKIMKGKRIQVQARVISLSPLVLDKKGNQIACTLKNNADAKSLRIGQIIKVSGVISGAGEERLLLSDTILVPDAKAGQITVNRKGKRPQGFFAVETLTQQLEAAANQVEKDFSIRDAISDVRLEGNRAVVDVIGHQVPPGISFSLDSLYADKSSDTLAFNMKVNDDRLQVNGYFVLAVVGIIIKASQPDISIDMVLEKIDQITKKEEKGKVVVNGWTYRLDFRDDRHSFFSATAPKRRK